MLKHSLIVAFMDPMSLVETLEAPRMAPQLSMESFRQGAATSRLCLWRHGAHRENGQNWPSHRASASAEVFFVCLPKSLSQPWAQMGACCLRLLAGSPGQCVAEEVLGIGRLGCRCDSHVVSSLGCAQIEFAAGLLPQSRPAKVSGTIAQATVVSAFLHEGRCLNNEPFLGFLVLLWNGSLELGFQTEGPCNRETAESILPVRAQGCLL